MSRVQGVEIGNAVDTEHDRLFVDDELRMLVLQRGLDDPGIAIGPVVAASGGSGERDFHGAPGGQNSNVLGIARTCW